VASDNWGHTSLLTSACVDNTVWDYLLRPLAPAPKVTHCRGDVQPFAPGPTAQSGLPRAGAQLYDLVKEWSGDSNSIAKTTG
jgi:hypothetical protein